MSNYLTIRDLSARTGVADPTLRMWERRYGFPQPARTPTGRRRYDEEQVEQIQRVLAGRSAGLSLRAAIERARLGDAAAPLSVYATVSRQATDLQPRMIAKPAMIALSHAIEDESLARGERLVLFACFQRERFYRAEESRWRELSEDAVAAVFADFAEPASPEFAPAEIPIADLPSLAREWAIVCYGQRLAICLAAREPASSSVGAPSSKRAFEAVWTVDPAAVREVAAACSEVASAVVPWVGVRAAGILALEPAVGAEEQLRLATGVINRTLAYLH